MGTYVEVFVYCGSLLRLGLSPCVVDGSLKLAFETNSILKNKVERENNGFEARWCGNRVTQGGSRPHVIFARNEVCPIHVHCIYNVYIRMRFVGDIYIIFQKNKVCAR